MLPLAAKESAADDVTHVVVPVLTTLAGALVAYFVAVLVSALVSPMARRSAVVADLSRRSRRPLRVSLVVVGAWIGLRIGADFSSWRRVCEHVLLIALIVSVTWLIGSLAFVLEDAATARYRMDVSDNRHARRIRTQVQVLRRITVAVLVICAAAGIALTFPAARAFGASLLASAGLISIVAGLAAQSSLAQVFAGMQLAFTDAIRVDDVVVVDGQWGRIEEITLTYVVVHVWDDRRLILPSTRFTTTSFENWTRRAAELLGTVELDVDWQVPVEDMRAELRRLLEETDLWDHRVGILQVTDAVGGMVRVRALASAVDAPTLFDLRCHVREGLVAWLQERAPQGIPHARWERVAYEETGGGQVRDGTASQEGGREGPGGPPSDGHPAAEPTSVQRAHDASIPTAVEVTKSAEPPERRRRRTSDDTLAMPLRDDSRLFTGSLEAVERSRSFQGPGADAIEEREQHAEGDK